MPFFFFLIEVAESVTPLNYSQLSHRVFRTSFQIAKPKVPMDCSPIGQALPSLLSHTNPPHPTDPHKCSKASAGLPKHHLFNRVSVSCPSITHRKLIYVIPGKETVKNYSFLLSKSDKYSNITQVFHYLLGDSGVRPGKHD